MRHREIGYIIPVAWPVIRQEIRFTEPVVRLVQGHPVRDIVPDCVHDLFRVPFKPFDSCAPVPSALVYEPLWQGEMPEGDDRLKICIMHRPDILLVELQFVIVEQAGLWLYPRPLDTDTECIHIQRCRQLKIVLIPVPVVGRSPASVVLRIGRLVLDILPTGNIAPQQVLRSIPVGCSIRKISRVLLLVLRPVILHAARNLVRGNSSTPEEFIHAGVTVPNLFHHSGQQGHSSIEKPSEQEADYRRQRHSGRREDPYGGCDLGAEDALERIKTAVRDE